MCRISVLLFVAAFWGASAELFTAQDLNTSSFGGRVLLCQNNTVSDGNASCVCDMGAEDVLGTCRKCLTGTFKDTVGAHACTSCPGNSGTVEEGSVSSAECLCSPGWWSEEGACSLCAAGTYKRSLGDYACTACPNSSVSSSGSVSLTDCLCDSGSTGVDGGPCIPCEEGKYKTLAGSALCVECGALMTSPAGSESYTACVCVTGHSLEVNGEYCSACPLNTYKSEPGMEACTPCPVNSVSPTASTNQLMCICAPAHTGPDGEACVACVAGKYKFSEGSDGCVECDGESFSGGGSISCTRCPLHSTVLDKSDGASCTCNAGYAHIAEQCVACLPGKYKDTLSNMACLECGNDTYGPSYAALSCTPCPAYTSSEPASISIETCICNAGYYAALDACSACEAGTYKDSISHDLCTACPTDTYSTDVAATDGSTCVVCPVSTSTHGEIGVSALEQCTCIAGFQPGTEPGTCDPCAESFFCTGRGAKTICMQHASSVEGSVELSDCVCQAGYYKTGSDSCSVCVADFYCIGDDSKTPCPGNSTSPQKTVSEEGCTCRAGFDRTQNV